MKDEGRVFRIMFVCMGNICRSPAAEAILKQLLSKDSSLFVHTESCGIGSWHVGRGADLRMKEASALREIHLDGKAQQFNHDFFDDFDYLLAADQEVLRHLHNYAETPEEKSKIHLMTEFSSLYAGQDVPDPYNGGNRGFEIVLDMLEDSCGGLISRLKNYR